MEKIYDFGIIGGGPAGYTAAVRAAELGKTVILFEKENLGGVCLNKGCIPTKTFLHAADFFKSLKKISDFGINIENYSIDYSKLTEKKEKVVKLLRNSLEKYVQSSGVEIVYQEAKITSSDATVKIKAGENEIECRHCFIATGSEPKCVGGFKFDHKFILSSDDILELKELPQKVVIVGSGAIGTEWARIYSSFGVEVHIVELAPHLLPLADFEISARLERTFRMAKIKTYLGKSVKSIEDWKVTLSDDTLIEPDFVLFATGRKSDVLAQINPAVQFIGDAFNGIQLAHFAVRQAIDTVEEFVLGKPLEEKIIPAVVYGEPEIAWFGKTEDELIKKNVTYKKSVYPVSALGKAQTEGNNEGFIKILAGEDDKILGCHIISKEASALIHQVSITAQNKLRIDDIKECCFAHPTYSEGIFESILRLK